MTSALATVKHKRIRQYNNRPNGPSSLSRTHLQHPPWRLDPLWHIRTSILFLLISTCNPAQTFAPRSCKGLLQPKVLLVEVRLSCCLESISPRLISKRYMQDLALWLSLRYGYSSSCHRKLILFVDVAQSTHARVQVASFSGPGDGKSHTLTLPAARRTGIRPEPLLV